MPSAHNNRAALSVPTMVGNPLLNAVGSDLTALTTLAMRTRDPACVRQFLEAIAPSVRKVCRAVLGSGHADLEDIIQECLIEILRALPKYRFEGTIVHYTNRIALRSAIAARKRGRHRDQRERALADQESANILGMQDTLPDLWFLRGIIDELSTVQAEVVVMRMVLGYSVEEIAAATQVSVNTSKSRLRVAKEYLRRRLDGEA
jgi:RNA polymerase sigma-70 factor (ECF subfamily)